VICVIYGTTGELIKLAPVLTRLRDRGTEFLNATTAQQVQQIPALLDQLGLPPPDVWLGRGARGRDLHTNRDIPGWLGTVAARFLRKAPGLKRRLGADGREPLVLVHGDTMTTVLGTLMGRALRVAVAHIEAGVRTHDVFHPFPEELNRRVVSAVASIHYAPGPAAVRNLRRGIVVDTGTNTIRDSIELAPRAIDLPPLVEGRAFGLVSLHRYELLKNRALLGETLRVLARHARRTPMLFIDHPVSVAAVRRSGLEDLFDDEHFVRMARLDFFGFVELMRRSSFVVTDSGGSQLETYVLNLPCLVHRKKVEQPEGVGENVVVSHFRVGELERFLEDPARHRRRAPLPNLAPSDVIVADLAQRGFIE
jgi:UDP-N-acetylglucosamine 2-epimerase (non-hydrolysing)